MFVITVSLLSSKSADNLNPFLFKYSDKLLHVILYFCLTFVTFIDFNQRKNKNPKLYNSFFAGYILLGGILEVLQATITDRSMGFVDFISNISGCIIALLIFNKYIRNKFYFKYYL